MNKILLFFLLLFVSQLSYSLDNQTYFKKISVKDGLSNNWVRCIYQDDYNYLWFGTSGGLNRYDGQNFKVYRPISADSLELGNVTINAIMKKDADNLWVCTDIGMYTYNYPNDKFTYYPLLAENFPFLTCTTDQEKNIWIGTNRGLIKVDKSLKLINKYLNNTLESNGLASNYVNVVYVDSKNNVWIGTTKGLNLYCKDTDSFFHFKKDDKPWSISGNDILSITEDRAGRIWVGTALDGLNLIEKKNNNLQFKPIIGGAIISLLADSENKLWVGHGAGGGIERIDLNAFQNGKLSIDRFKNDPIDLKTLSDNSVFCIYQDKFKDIWIGTFGKGINYFSRRSKSFHIVEEKYGTNTSIKNNLVNAFFEEEKYLWIGTEGGLDRLDKKTGLYEHFENESNNPNSMASNPVFKIYKDSRGNLWIGNWAGGLSLFNYKTNSFKRFMPDGKPGSISNENVFSIVEDKQGNLWVTTIGGGLDRYDYSTGKFIVYQHNPQNPCSINGDYLNFVFTTSTGDLYVSLHNLIDKFNYKTGCFDHIYNTTGTDSVFYGNVTSIFEDSKKNIWIATNTGLYYYNPANNSFKIFTVKHGLPDNTIQGILEDDHGNLWLGTNKGLSKFINAISIPNKPEFINFTVADGLPANDFKRGATLKNSQGFLYFGTSGGYVWFHPDSIHFNPIPPEIVLTRFEMLNSMPDNQQTYSSVTENINHLGRIVLKYGNTDFKISFAALNFLNSEKNQYKYKLDGYDSDWIIAGHNTDVTYTNIQPGDYTFVVSGSNNDGVWCEKDKKLGIKILPPWWNTLLFKIALVLTLLFLAGFSIWLRISSLNRYNKVLEKRILERTDELVKLNSVLKSKQREIVSQNTQLEKHQNHLEKLVSERTSQLEEAKNKAEESDRLKSAFLANMSHEIRTPMNAILGFSSLLRESGITEKQRIKFTDLIIRNGNILHVLINDVINISIMEAGQMALNICKFDAIPILNELFNFYEKKNSKKIQLLFLNQKVHEPLILTADLVRFKQILVNLLNNAFKYTETGKIEFGFKKFKKKILFFVVDTGIGIEKDDQARIFDHFYKIEQSKIKLYGGTGIGLAICKQLINQMGGVIWVKSVINVGSTFYFSLPFENE